MPSEGMKFDTGKIRYELVPPDAVHQLALVLTYGALKYEPNSWQGVADAVPRYLGAALRHIFAYKSNEHLDKESGLHHLSHALCNLVFLVYFESSNMPTEPPEFWVSVRERFETMRAAAKAGAELGV